MVKDLHSYDLPEVLALDATGGSEAYLDWVRANTVRDSTSSVTSSSSSSSSLPHQVQKVSVCEEDSAVKMDSVTGEVVATQSAQEVAQESLTYDTTEGTAETGSV